MVIPCKVRMGVYSVCASLKRMAKSGRTDVEIKNYKTLLKEHRESQALERSKAMHHRQKALQSSERYMCLRWHGSKEDLFATFSKVAKGYWR